MKSKLLAFTAISVLAVFSPTYSIADAATVTPTPAAEAVDSDAVLHRAREAIQCLETACLNHDQSGIAGAVTQDVIAEYALPEDWSLDRSDTSRPLGTKSPINDGSVKGVPDVRRSAVRPNGARAKRQ